MAKPGASLKASLRQSVIGAYRARGRGKNNLWLVSSVKNHTDWIIPSDRQLIHWIACLETNPDVLDFDLAPEPIPAHDDNELKAIKLDAIVSYSNRKIGWHEITAGKNKHASTQQSQPLAQTAAASKAPIEYCIFSDSDLKPQVKVAIRWMKPLAYANAIHDQEHGHYRTSLVRYFKQQGSGSIVQILKAMPEHDPAIVLGMVSRLAIQGVISIDLSKISFGLLTPWHYHG